ncbi:hypothetical protein BGW38_007109 [Lunasporangiospora selenospora]|uniref:F-box domain-containing protein n=1 Tax=Lunasporangiospora selenospora TaxID=979761 RepID=A0A9P6FLF9_9FUNG|nr:hypothetical protein BGW38_007109 [Lunasporangiospora selenospora]
MIHKNSFCDWDLIMDVVRGLPRLNKLSVHWKNTSSIPGGSWRSAIQPQVEPDLTNLSLENTSIPNELQNHSLKRLEISYTQFVNETLLDVIYKTCPNIRYFQLASAKSRSPTTINNAIHRLLQSCRDLKSLQYFGSTSEYYGSTTTNLNSRIFQDSSRTWILLSELTLSLVNLEDPAEIELLGGNAPFSLSKLDIRGIGNTQQLNAVLKSFSTLTHLSVAGKFDGHAWTHLWHNDEARFYWTCQISAFASGQTLQHLDISELLIESHVLHERLFDKIQELPQLTCLLIDYDHLVKADLELTWPYRCDEEEMKHGAALPKWYQQNSESHSRLGARFPYPFWTQSQLVSAFEKKSREAHLQLRLQQLRQGNYFDFDFDYTFDIDGMREDELAENTRQHRHDYNYELSVQPLDGDAIGTNVSSSTSLSAEAQAERTNFFERTFRMFSQLQTLHVHEQSPTNCRDSILGNRFLSLHMVHAIAGMAPKLQRVSYHQSLKLDISRARKAYPHMDFYPVCN